MKIICPNNESEPLRSTQKYITNLDEEDDDDDYYYHVSYSYVEASTGNIDSKLSHSNKEASYMIQPLQLLNRKKVCMYN